MVQSLGITVSNPLTNPKLLENKGKRPDHSTEFVDFCRFAYTFGRALEGVFQSWGVGRAKTGIRGSRLAGF